MSKLPPALHVWVKRILDRKRVREFAEEIAEHTGDHRHVVRRQVIIEHVAKRMGAKVNNAFCREVTHVLMLVGWEPIRPTNKALFRCVKLKSQTDEEAIEYGRKLGVRK